VQHQKGDEIMLHSQHGGIALCTSLTNTGKIG